MGEGYYETLNYDQLESGTADGVELRVCLSEGNSSGEGVGDTEEICVVALSRIWCVVRC